MQSLRGRWRVARRGEKTRARTHPLSLLVCALAGLACAQPELARACTTVLQYVAAPPSGALIPGNLVFFQVMNEASGVALALVDVDTGATVPSAIVSMGGDRLLMPEKPLEAGRHLALVERRSDPSAQLVEIGRHPFTTTEPAAIELRPASLRIVEDHGNEVVLRYTSPDASGAAKHLLTVSATVDGRDLWPESPAGDRFVVRSSCDGTIAESSCGNVLNVGEGGHRVEVRAHVLGSAVQPEAVHMDVETSCGGCTAGPQAASARGGLLPMLLGLLFWCSRARRQRVA